MTRCIICNRYDKICDAGHRVEFFFGFGDVSINESGSEIDCHQFVPHVDFGSKIADDYNSAMKHRKMVRARHELGFEKSRKCTFCGHAVCRCESRRNMAELRRSLS